MYYGEFLNDLELIEYWNANNLDNTHTLCAYHITLLVAISIYYSYKLSHIIRYLFSNY